MKPECSVIKLKSVLHLMLLVYLLLNERKPQGTSLERTNC